PIPWGSDHVGKPLPEYVTGDECLFCHRADVGPAWTTNRHHRSLTEADPTAPALAALKQSPSLEKYANEVKLLLGGSRQTRYLKPAKEYGKLELLSVAWAGGKLVTPDNPHWDASTFQAASVGCHTTDVYP